MVNVYCQQCRFYSSTGIECYQSGAVQCGWCRYHKIETTAFCTCDNAEKRGATA